MASGETPEEQIFEIFSQHDEDGNGFISFEEFAQLMLALDPSNFSDENNAKALYSQVDADADGNVNYNELCEWLIGGQGQQFMDGGGGEEEGEAGVLRNIGDAPESELAAPTYWSSKGESRATSFEQVPDEICRTLQELLDQTFKRVKTRDREEGKMPTGMQILDVQRIENLPLWRRYANFRYKLEKKRPHKCTPYDKISGEPLETSCVSLPGELNQRVNEVYLFHGTSKEGASGIGQTGFRLDLAGSGAGTMYGNGAYLAECSSKSDEYAKEDDEGCFNVLLCRASLGQLLHLTTGGRDTHPMITAAISSGAYDSVLGDREASVGTYEEFVCYSEDQIYPEYMIRYKRVFTDDDAEGSLPNEVLPEPVPKNFTAVFESGGAEHSAEFATSKDLWNGTLMFKTHSTTSPRRSRAWVQPKGSKICADNTRSKWQLIAIESNLAFFEAPYTGPIPPLSGWQATSDYPIEASMSIQFPPAWDALRTGYIENVRTGAVMAIGSSNRNKGANIVTWGKSNGKEQLWTLTPDGKIKSHLNGLVLGISHGRKNRGQRLTTWTDGGPDKYWEMTPEGMIVSKYCNLAVGIASAKKEWGGQIVTWNKDGNWDKIWKFSPHPLAES